MSANSSQCVSFTESAAYKHSTQPDLLFVVTALELLDSIDKFTLP